MSGNVLILRPQPGADETASRARALGLEPVVTPLFEVRPLAWTPPDPAEFDTVLLTSAHAARQGGDGLASLRALPCYAVGERTAGAARAAGFKTIRTGPSDGIALLPIMAADGVERVFHPCGREHLDLDHPALAIRHEPVYATDATERLPSEAKAALDRGALVLLHSPRAAAVFAQLAAPWRASISIAAISPAAAAAAGDGWRLVAAASAPRDEALLELAAKLCQTERVKRRSDG
jgi:uroporphyrinogen-III synthase